MLQTTCQLATADLFEGKPFGSERWLGLTGIGGPHSKSELNVPLIFQFCGGMSNDLFKYGGILNTCIWKTEKDLLGSMVGDRIVPFRQHRGNKPRFVSFSLVGGRSIIVGNFSQLNA
jgi:hypothetical protein